MKAFSVCWPDNKLGLVVCQDELHLYEILEAESDITQCTVMPCQNDMLIMLDSNTTVYTETKKQFYTKIESPCSLADDLYRMQQEGDLCDVTLKVENHCIPCHKTVLSARSSFFRSMFTSEFKESSQKEIEIDINFPVSLLDKIIQFIYTSELNIDGCDSNESDGGGAEPTLETITKDMHTLLDCMNAADYLDIPSLSVHIQQRLSELCAHGLRLGDASDAYIATLLEVYEVASKTNLRDLQKNIASCMPNYAGLHDLELSPSLQEDITTAFQMERNTPFYFGADHKLHELLEYWNLSEPNALTEINQLEEAGASLQKIFGGHVLVDRACSKSLCSPDMFESIWLLIRYFVEMKNYPINCLDFRGQSMLQIAAINRELELVQRLLQLKASCQVATGPTLVESVYNSCSSDIAYFIVNDILLGMNFRQEAEENPYRVMDMINQHKDLWRTSQKVMRDLWKSIYKEGEQDMITEGTITNQQEVDSKSQAQLEALGISLNEEFIKKSAEVLTNSASISQVYEGLALGLFPRKGTGPFSGQFLSDVMSHLFPAFMRCLQVQHPASLEEACQVIRRQLTQDILTQKWKQAPRRSLCSLKQLHALGVFSMFPLHSWIIQACDFLPTFPNIEAP